MTTLDELLLILGVVYLLGALIWLPHGAVVVARFAGRATVRDGSALTLNHRGGFAITSPLPFDDAIVAAQWPVSLSPAGVFAYVPTTLGTPDRPEQTARWLPWESITRVTRDERTILVNGEPLATCATAAQARFLARRLARLAKLSPAQREPALHALLDASFNLPRLRRRLARFDRRVVALRVASTLLALLVFAAVPILARTVGLLPRLPYLAAAFVLLLAATLGPFARLFRDYYPRRPADRWRNLATMLVAPIYAMRAPDLLAHELAARYHPLPLAAIRCSPSTFRAFAGRVLRDMEHPIEPLYPPTTDEPPRAAEQWMRAQLHTRTLALLTTMGLTPADLRQPDPSAPGSAPGAGGENISGGAYFCPRCLGRFTDPTATCTVCHLPVVA